MSTLRKVLDGLWQGDLISVGAISVVGQGLTPALGEAIGPPAGAGLEQPESGALWNLTVESEIGWYVLLSGPCDIVRDPTVEPCVVVCPVRLVSDERYVELRRGPYSPREFPLPAEKLRKACQWGRDRSFNPVADQRYITSVDKTVLADPSVGTLRPLTGPQQARFRDWAGARYSRPAHPDAIDRSVLRPAAKVVSRLARQVSLQAGKRPLEVKLVAATDEWLLTTTEQFVTFHPVLTEAGAKAAGLYDTKNSSLDNKQIVAAAKKIASAIGLSISPDAGYRVTVEPTTWDGMSAAHFQERARWVWNDGAPDPLASTEEDGGAGT